MRITVYARFEPAADPMLSEKLRGSPFHRDVVVYREREAVRPLARWPWHYSKPRKMDDYVTLNGWERKLVWLPDKAEG